MFEKERPLSQRENEREISQISLPYKQRNFKSKFYSANNKNILKDKSFFK